MSTWTVLALVTCIASGVLANAIRVPGEYATIQGALDNLTEGDTVIVDSGTYAEALTAPPCSFVLLGNCDADTNTFGGPWVEPTNLPGSDTLACLILPNSAQATIERFGFRNGNAMYPQPGHIRPIGGIKVLSAQLTTLRDCVFDSVWQALVVPYEGSGNLCLQRCRFKNCAISAVWGGGQTTTVVEDCRFSMSIQSECGQVFTRSGSAVRRCIFEGQTGSGAVGMSGQNLELRDCVFRDFGPADVQYSPNVAIYVAPGSSGVVENNLITDCELIGVAIHVACNADSLLIRHNHLVRCAGPGLGVLSGIEVPCSEIPNDSAFVVIEDNTFENNVSNDATKSLLLWQPASVRRNRFLHNDPDTTGCVGTGWNGLEMHENILIGNSIGVDETPFLGPPVVVHAEWNYWGDSSGPYNEAQNPQGLGDAVRGATVLFDPWHPDTAFLSTSRPITPLAHSISFTVYPSPFNANATLDLVVPESGIFTIDLFNILGQHVQKIWSGTVAHEIQLPFCTAQLSSGLYFVCVHQTVGNRVVALQKAIIAK